MSNGSRFDKRSLMDDSGNILNEILYPETTIFSCDLRVIDDKSPLLPNTKAVLLLGQRAHSTYTKLNTTLDEHRGNPILVGGIYCISSFSPRDTKDVVDHESRLNEELSGENVEYEGEEGGDLLESKGRGKTARANYAFWLKRDVKKVYKIVENNGQLPKLYDGTPSYHIYPSGDTVISILSRTKNDTLYFDMETDFVSLDMRCFAFSFASDPLNIYVVPTLDVNYKMAYDIIPQIIRSLAVAIRDNEFVAHNGSGFDFLILAIKYGIPIGKRVFDTMVAAQRCIVGDSLIDTVNGKIPIKDLVGKNNFYVWSWKNDKPYPAKVNSVNFVGNEPIIRVHYWKADYIEESSHRFYIDCTPDHKFRLINGSWVEAQHLKPMDRLTSIKVCYSNYNDYHTITPEKYKTVKSHRYIFETIYNKTIPKGYVIHHKDENKHNNSPDNLELLSAKMHRHEHAMTNGFGYAGVGNIPTNKNTLNGKPITKEQLEELYNSGMSQKQIGEQLKADASNISILFKRFGIKTRTLSQAQRLRRENEGNAKVIGIELLHRNEDVYCMEVEDTNCFSCGNIIIHNCYPEIEKSLGHWVSLCTFEEYHKNTGAHGYANSQQADQLYLYCGKDVFTMYLIHKWQLAFMEKDSGLKECVSRAMQSIKPYLTMTIMGIKFDDELRQKKIKENDRLMLQYIRIMGILMGKNVEPLISNKKCVKYFHELLGYKHVLKTEKGGASLKADALFKLKLAHENPVIDFLLKYREVQKETSTLNFKVWQVADAHLS